MVGFVGRLCHGPPRVESTTASKDKIFVGQLFQDRLPSGVEMLKRHMLGALMCPLFGVSESGTHILFSCPAARFLWRFVHEALDLIGRPRTLTSLGN